MCVQFPPKNKEKIHKSALTHLAFWASWDTLLKGDVSKKCLTKRSTSLRSFLSRDFLFYIILRTFAPGKKTFCDTIIEEHPCHHGDKQLSAPTMACDVRMPQLGALTSSSHHE